MDILFISDYVCPYCLAAKEALKQALAETGVEAAVTWQPLELTPEPRERVDTYHDEKRRAGYQILAEPCKKLGLDMKLPPCVVPRPYTRLAFEGWYYACANGKGEEYNDAVYRAYFINEKDIGEIAVLADIADAAGLDREDFAAALREGRFTETERNAVSYTRNVLKPRGVPTIYIDGEKISLQEYTKEEMIRILTDQAAKTAETEFGCSENGCG